MTAAIGAAAAGSPLAVLGTLTVRGAAEVAGYSRAQFGQAWADIDRNGCDTRNDVLRRDLTDVVVKPGTHGCVVLGGTLLDPYSGDTVSYAKGDSMVSVDHVVALADGWRTGANAWTAAKRAQFANDPLNLLATTTSANKAKADHDAAGWLPEPTAVRCSYVARQVAVKAKYGASVTPQERTAIGQVLQSCGSAVLPSAPPIPLMPKLTPTASAEPVTSAKPTTPTTPTKPKPEKTTSPPPAPPAGVYYANCSAARAAGAAPIHVGEPGYRSGLDRDGDGVACE